MIFIEPSVFPDMEMHDKTVKFPRLCGEISEYLAVKMPNGCSVQPYYSIIATRHAVDLRTLRIKPHAYFDFFEFVTQPLLVP